MPHYIPRELTPALAPPRSTQLTAAATAAAIRCAATTALIQGIMDDTSKAGGGYAEIPCGFHATLALVLPHRVKLDSARCTAGSGAVVREYQSQPLLTLGACQPGVQKHIIAVGNGTGQAISGVVFDHTNLTNEAGRSSCAVTGGGGSQGFVLENSRFENINMTSQGFSAIQMAGCSGCTVRGNYVPNSGGDALNFNSATRAFSAACFDRLPRHLLTVLCAIDQAASTSSRTTSLKTAVTAASL